MLLGVGNKVLMLENAIYSVISPKEQLPSYIKMLQKLTAAEAMKITADHILEIKVIDGIIPEPEAEHTAIFQRKQRLPRSSMG